MTERGSFGPPSSVQPETAPQPPQEAPEDAAPEVARGWWGGEAPLVPQVPHRRASKYRWEGPFATRINGQLVWPGDLFTPPAAMNLESSWAVPVPD